MTAPMDETTLAGIEQDFPQAVKDLGELLRATNVDPQAAEGVQHFVTGSAGIITQLVAEVRGLSAALARVEAERDLHVPDEDNAECDDCGHPWWRRRGGCIVRQRLDATLATNQEARR